MTTYQWERWSNGRKYSTDVNQYTWLSNRMRYLLSMVHMENLDGSARPEQTEGR